MRSILLDTRALFWYAKGDKRFGQSARELINDPQTIPFISVVSLWEITIKTTLGKLDLGTSFDSFTDELPKQGFFFIDIKPEDLRILHSLPMHHGDPFDRLIIAQAMTRTWPIISDDSKFSQYPVELITA